jgi:hypothetical protein
MTRTANWIAKSCWLSLARCICNPEVLERVVPVVDLADLVAQRVGVLERVVPVVDLADRVGQRVGVPEQVVPVVDLAALVAQRVVVPERVVPVVDLADLGGQRVGVPEQVVPVVDLADRVGRKDKGMILSVWSSMRWSSMPIRMASSIGTNCSSLLGACHLLATKALGGLGDVLVKRVAVAQAAPEDRVVQEDKAVVVEVAQVDLTGALRVVAHNGHNALSNLATRLQ